MHARVKAALVFALGAALLLVGVLGHQWLVAGGTRPSVVVGLRGIELCRRDEACETVAMATVDPRLKAIAFAGQVAQHAALVGAALGLIAAVLSLARVRVPGPIAVARVATLVLLAALLAMVAFVTITSADGGVGVGTSALLGLCGAGLASAGTWMLDRVERAGPAPAASAASPAGAMPPPWSPRGPVPACPACRAPTAWVAEHDRWMCARCSLYL